MKLLRTIALVTTLAAGALLWPLVRLWAEPGALEAAHSALTGGDYPKAISLYTDVLQNQRLESTVLAAVYKERAVARHKNGAAIQAIADYTNAIWLGTLPDAQLARAFLNRGIAYVEIGELVRARRDFDSAIGKDRHLADAYFGRATTLRLLGKPEAALPDYEQALALGHEQPTLVRYGRGLALETLGRRDEAVAEFSEAALSDPKLSAARTKLLSLGVAPPSDQAVQARQREIAARTAAAVPKSPEATITLADAGEVLTLASSALEDDMPTGALPARTSIAPPQILSSARPAALTPSHIDPPPAMPSPAPPAPAVMPPAVASGSERAAAGPKPSFLRPARDTIGSDLLAEQALAANARAGGIPEPVALAPPPPVSAEIGAGLVKPDPTRSAAPPSPVTDDVDAAAATGALPPAPPALRTPSVATPVLLPGAPPKPQPENSAAAGYFLQLGAYSDKIVAERGAQAFSARFPSVAASHAVSVDSAIAGARGTLYRVRLGPFKTEDETRALCSSLKAQAQACIPVLPK